MTAAVMSSIFIHPSVSSVSSVTNMYGSQIQTKMVNSEALKEDTIISAQKAIRILRKLRRQQQKILVAIACTTMLLMLQLAYTYSPNVQMYADLHRIDNHIDELYKSRCGNLDWPEIWDHFPQFEQDSDKNAKMLTPKGHEWNRLVFGIPSVARDKKTYLIETLDSLFSQMDHVLRHHVLIVVYLSGTMANETDYVEKTFLNITERFENWIKEGSLEVITPSLAWYPKEAPPLPSDKEKLNVYWRTKQNRDFMVLMNYAKSRGDFYVQLEDDLQAAHNSVRNMWNFMDFQKTDSRWFTVEFALLGMYGKVFRCYDIPKMITLAAVTHLKKPIDWIWEDYMRTLCDWVPRNATCKPRGHPALITYHPAQFRHLGLYSSLKEKVQRVQEPYWNRPNKYFSRNNPNAVVTTSMKILDEPLQRCYQTYMWARLLVNKGEYIRIAFVAPFALKNVFFSSGNSQYPRDLLTSDVSVELEKNGTNEDIGRFNGYGSFTANLDGLPVEAVVLRVTGEWTNATVLLEQMFLS